MFSIPVLVECNIVSNTEDPASEVVFPPLSMKVLEETEEGLLDDFFCLLGGHVGAKQIAIHGHTQLIEQLRDLLFEFQRALALLNRQTDRHTEGQFGPCRLVLRSLHSGLNLATCSSQGVPHQMYLFLITLEVRF